VGSLDRGRSGQRRFRRDQVKGDARRGLGTTTYLDDPFDQRAPGCDQWPPTPDGCFGGVDRPSDKPPIPLAAALEASWFGGVVGATRGLREVVRGYEHATDKAFDLKDWR